MWGLQGSDCRGCNAVDLGVLGSVCGGTGQVGKEQCVREQGSGCGGNRW